MIELIEFFNCLCETIYNCMFCLPDESRESMINDH